MNQKSYATTTQYLWTGRYVFKKIRETSHIKDSNLNLSANPITLSYILFEITLKLLKKVVNYLRCNTMSRKAPNPPVTWYFIDIARRSSACVAAENSSPDICEFTRPCIRWDITLVIHVIFVFSKQTCCWLANISSAEFNKLYTMLLIAQYLISYNVYHVSV